MDFLDDSSRWQGIDLRSTVEHTGTPALLLSESRLLANAHELRAGLESCWPAVTLRYCAKTNPEPRVLEVLRPSGVEVMAAHEMEVLRALVAGYAPSSIAYQCPVLNEPELDRVIAAGVRRFHAFRGGDLEVLSGAAMRAGVEIRVSLRLASARSTVAFLGRSGRRLGFRPDALHEVANRPGIVIDALNSYRGTQQVTPEAYRDEVRALAAAARTLRARGLTITEINLGGGVPSPSLGRRTSLLSLLGFSDGRPKLALRDFAARLSRIFSDEVASVLDPHPVLALEPGRSIVGNAMVLLTRVRAVQDSWCFLDEGRNVLVESPMVFARPMAPLEARSGSAVVHLSGPTLNTLDVVAYGRRLPPLRNGDVLAIGDAGAYCFSRATRYAGLLPAVWSAAGDGSLTCIRSADTAGDFVR